MRRAAVAGLALLAALAPGPGVEAQSDAGAPLATSRRPCGEWGSYGRVPARTFDYDCPSAISPTTAGSLLPRWVFKTEKTVTASPVVAGGRVFVGDWSATMYALDADTGAELWRFSADDAPGAPFGPIVATAAVADVGGRSLVVFGSGPTMHAVDAATGEEVWSTYAGSAARPEDHPDDEQTEFESSPVVVDGIVYSGLDVHNRTVEENYGVRGGVFAFDLATGEVLGFFDVEHDHVDDVTGERLSGCSGVWSSPTVDAATGTLYFATGNCPHDLPPGTDWGRHVEAVTAIDADPSTWVDPASAVRWTFTPEPLNRDDTDFGATPNLFLDANGRQLLGIGKKDAVYYALDPGTGALAWSTKVTEPGNVDRDFAVGGFIGSTATGRGGIFGATAIGSPPYYHALDGATGAVRWSGLAGPSYAASAFVNGVVIAGALDDVLKLWDARTGALLGAHVLAGPISSGPAVVGDRVYVGSGTASSDLCAKDTPGGELCLALFDDVLGATGGVHAFELAAPGHRAAAGPAGNGILLGTEGDNLWAYDAATLERRVLLRDLDGGGPVCADPSRAGDAVVAGRYVQVKGSVLDDLVATVVGAVGPGAGCAFLGDGRLVTTSDDRLLLWTPPSDGGAPAPCVVAEGLAGAAGVLVDGEAVLVAAGDGVHRFVAGGCSPWAGDLLVPMPATSAVAASGRGTFYVASATAGTIAEHAADGSFLRLVLTPLGVPGLSTGTPAALAVGADGTLYYADSGVLGVGPLAANATVRRIRFGPDGAPLAPETLNAGLDAAAGVALLPGPSARAVPAPAAASTPAAVEAPAPGSDGALARTGSATPLVAGVVALALALATRSSLRRAA